MRTAGGIVRPRFVWTATRTLIAINVGVFFLQGLTEMSGLNLTDWFVLTIPGLKRGMVWTLFTYAFLHSGFWHLAFNMIGLWCAGGFIQKSENRGRLFAVYGGGVVLGALAWLAVWAWNPSPLLQGVCMGASAGVLACMAYLLFNLFNESITFLLYFIIPVRLRSKWVLAFLSVVTVGGLVFAEIPEVTRLWQPLWITDVAHSAHLGGLIWGAGMFAWSRWKLRQPVQFPRRVTPLRQTVTVHAHDGVARAPATLLFPGAGKVFPEAEVNRILDKINASGIDSLTRAEREVLEWASTASLKK
ncbi:MAG: rhomboid family intramembrane serine protease [Puniceicoccales bacterium]|jgi:membrane associated rhomboid family serine protease|nr:rhomboid family intramembrane serine protease [Puniceicoccales bacterium]